MDEYPWKRVYCERTIQVLNGWYVIFYTVNQIYLFEHQNTRIMNDL